MVDEPLVAAVRSGDRRAVARALTVVENDPGGALATALFPFASRAHIVGVTGPPGSGKSTLVAAMTAVYRARGQTVGILAVDASSPFSGGALLGDRVRMEAHSGDSGVFIRSMASRGSLGGLALATVDAARVLDAAGFDVVILETVGVGQLEVEIAAEAHTTVVVLVPGLGDGIQALKAGILEIADVFVVNKADLPGADGVVADLSAMLGLTPATPETWRSPVVPTVATTGGGVTAVVDAVAAHADFLRRHGGWQRRERARLVVELQRRLHARLVYPLLNGQAGTMLDKLLDRLVTREIPLDQALEELIAGQRHAVDGARLR